MPSHWFSPRLKSAIAQLPVKEKDRQSIIADIEGLLREIRNDIRNDPELSAKDKEGLWQEVVEIANEEFTELLIELKTKVLTKALRQRGRPRLEDYPFSPN